MRDVLRLFHKDGNIIIQKGDYQEDGFFISIVDNVISLNEIPTGGGMPIP